MSHESPGEWYSYAVIRIVPQVEREEFVNAGVILFAPAGGRLCCRVRLDADRLRALAGNVDLTQVEQHLRTFESICRGDPDGGPIAELPVSERFHWLTAPRSTVIQVSAVHEGWTADIEGTLDQLFTRYVGSPDVG
jgi:hypothetical protein